MTKAWLFHTQLTRALPALGLISVSVFLFRVPLRAADDPFPEGPGKAILMRACTQCHVADAVAAQHRTRDEWKDTVDAMKGYGADLSEEDTGVLLDYLTKNFGKQ